MIFLLTDLPFIITLSPNITTTLHLFSIYYSFLQMSRSVLIFLASLTVALNLCALYFIKAKSFTIFFYIDVFSHVYYYSFYLLRTLFIFYHSRVCVHLNFKRVITVQVCVSKKFLLRHCTASFWQMSFLFAKYFLRLLFSFQNATPSNSWLLLIFLSNMFFIPINKSLFSFITYGTSNLPVM